MKRILVITVLAMAMFSLALGQTNSSQTNQSSSVEQAMKQLGSERIQATQKSDTASSERVYPGDDVVIGAHRTVRNKARVDCDESRPRALQKAINKAHPGDTILVSGTCNENVTIPVGKDLITLEGGGEATINGPDATQSTLLVRGREITIKGFTITGGQSGIDVSRGGWAVIDGNTIHNTGLFGIVVADSSFAVIVNNTSRNNPMAGIGVFENAVARIGFVDPRTPVASPNLLTANGTQGITVRRGSFARIVGNDISNNTVNGIDVREAADALITDNTINGNGTNGIFVSQGSGVILGADAGNTIFTRPNTTTTNNLGFGIRCQVGGYTDGRRGSLHGDSGAENYSEGCINSLLP